MEKLRRKENYIVFSRIHIFAISVFFLPFWCPKIPSFIVNIFRELPLAIHLG